MGKYWHTLTGALCVLGLAITTQAIAQVPYVNFKSFDLAGDSVTGGGEWSLNHVYHKQALAFTCDVFALCGSSDAALARCL